MKKTIIKTLIMSAFILCALFLMQGKVSADHVVGTSINVRSGPGTDYS